MLYSLKTEKSELYNLRNDIAESKDLSSSNKPMVQSLLKQLYLQLLQWKAPMPLVKATGERLDYLKY